MTGCRIALALALVLLLAGAGPVGAEGLWLTDADLDAVLQDDGPDLDPMSGASGPGGAAPRRWWPIALSAVLPGLGEITTGHMRGIPMMAADGAIWWLVHDKQQEGEDKEAEFEAFALEHWDQQEWEAALALEDGNLQQFFPEYSGVGPDAVPLYVSRELDEREWFENAGKWDQFAWGWREYWDDIWNAEHHPGFLGPEFYAPQPGTPATWFFADNATMTPLRREYIEMRQSSNDAFEARDTLLSAALLLRVFSVLQMVYLEGFVGQRYGASDLSGPGPADPQASWRADASADGSGLLSWRMTW